MCHQHNFLNFPYICHRCRMPSSGPSSSATVPRRAPVPKDVAGEAGVAGAPASASERSGAPGGEVGRPPRRDGLGGSSTSRSPGAARPPRAASSGGLPGRPPRRVSPPASGRLSSYVGRGVLVPFCIALVPFLLRSASMWGSFCCILHRFWCSFSRECVHSLEYELIP